MTVRIQTYFQGAFEGWGVALSPLGRVLRRFDITLEGRWSQEHRALHLEETYAYGGGDRFERRWAVHADDDGRFVGHDALELARLRGRSIPGGVVMKYDRLPDVRAGAPARARQVIRIYASCEDRALMIGHVIRFGVPVARVNAALVKVP